MAKRRPSGDGMVRKREDDRWEGRIVVGHKDNGDSIFRYVYADTQKELTARLRKCITAYQGVDLTEQSRLTLSEWLDQWLVSKEGMVRPGTLNGYRGYIENHIRPCLGEKRISQIKAVDIQRFYDIAVSIEGQQSSPSLSQAQKMRELDKDGKLNGDVIDGILSQEKKEVDKVIINSAELEKYFGKDNSPREMKDKIISLLDDWKAKQPPELGKPEKKTDLEK